MNGSHALVDILASIPLLAWAPSLWEIIMILVVGLLLFGRKLPEVGRSLGRSIVEFKKGLKDVSSEVEEASREPMDRPKLAARSDAVARGAGEQSEAKAGGS